MWFPFLRPRDRFSLDELRYLTDQLQNVQIINEVNKDFVIEALRSIAELITYGDQHDPTFFEFFMDSQVMEKFVRLIKISRAATVSLQLLQTMSIMIENLKSEHAMYYMFSNEHINYLITYSFDFRNEELLSYYISFLRAISGKLNKNIISLLVKTEKDEVVSFPLYVEAIRFAFHEENMIRTAVRALTLNVYHVGDDCVNRYVVSTPHADYFSNLVSFFRKQCIHLNGLVSEILKNPGADSTSTILAAVDEIEDNLYYISDVISAGIPDVGQLITDNILHILIFPFILPSLWIKPVDEIQIGAITSLYLLCCILRIVKIKDLANAIAAALFCSPEAFVLNPEAKINGQVPGHDFFHESQQPDLNNLTEMDSGHLRVTVPNLSSSSQIHLEDIVEHADSSSHMAFRETLLSYVTSGDDMHVLGSLSVLATFLQTKELDESILDALGILPQRKQHKKLLLQALVGEVSGEEQLFSSGDENSGQLHNYLMKLKEYYGVLCSFPVVGASPRIYKFQVLDSLVSLLCRSNISAETLWEGGWLLRQILPYSETEFSRHHLELLKDTYMNCTSTLVKEIRGIWTDLLVTVICEEWKKCKRAIEGSSPPKEPKSMFLPSQKSSPEDILVESSFAAGERMLELVKVFVLLYQLQIFCQGRTLPEQPPVHPPFDVPTNSRATNAGVDVSGPKPGTELKLADAVPCIIAFERGKERHVCFLAISRGTSGWVVLVEELPLKQQHGVVRVAAPLAGSNPIIDDKHPRWLHLRIRPSTLPRVDPAKSAVYGKAKAKALVDGRWTLAFKDEQSCSSAFAMVLEEIDVQRNVVERRLEPLLGLERGVDNLKSSLHTQQACSSSTMPSNSL